MVNECRNCRNILPFVLKPPCETCRAGINHPCFISATPEELASLNCRHVRFGSTNAYSQDGSDRFGTWLQDMDDGYDVGHAGDPRNYE